MPLEKKGSYFHEERRRSVIAQVVWTAELACRGRGRGRGRGQRNTEQVCTRWVAAIQPQISSFSGAAFLKEEEEGERRKEGRWVILGLAEKWATAGFPPHCRWFICRRPPINRFPPLIYYWRLLCRMQGFPLADSVATSAGQSLTAQNSNFWQIDELVLEPCCRSVYLFLKIFPLKPLPPSLALACCANCAAYQMKWSTSGGLALSGNSTEQTERGIQLKCWKTFRKEGDVIPPQLGGVATASSRPPRSPDSCSGNSRQDETHPDTPSAPDCVTDQDDVLPRISALAFFFLS